MLNSAAVVECFAAGLRLCDIAIRQNVAREPYVSAYGRAVADGNATEDGRAGVYHHVVFNYRMTRVAFDQCAVLANRKPLGAERHRLIQADALADLRRLADHDAGAVVDEEAAVNLGARMDVDAGGGVRQLRDDAKRAA